MPKAVAYVVVAALLIVGYDGWSRAEREKGAQRVLLHQADSTHHADSVASIELTRIALAASEEAAVLRVRFRDAQARDHAVAGQREAATARLASVRDSALAVARDSAATVGALRQQIERLVGASDSAEASHAREVEALRHSLRLAASTIEADSSAIARSLVALNAATARAVAAESQARLLRRMLPSTLGGWTKLAAAGGVGYLLARGTR